MHQTTPQPPKIYDIKRKVADTSSTVPNLHGDTASGSGGFKVPTEPNVLNGEQGRNSLKQETLLAGVGEGGMEGK